VTRLRRRLASERGDALIEGLFALVLVLLVVGVAAQALAYAHARSVAAAAAQDGARAAALRPVEGGDEARADGRRGSCSRVRVGGCRRRALERRTLDRLGAQGYTEIIPPTFEYAEVFTRAGGTDITDRLIRFFDLDGRLLALRYDFTASVARLAATKLADTPPPLRLCYAGRVFRQDPSRESGRPLACRGHHGVRDGSGPPIL